MGGKAMQFRSLISMAAAALGVLFLVGAALAQDGAPAWLRGNIEALNGNVLSINTREGEKVDVTLAENFRVNYPTILSLNDLSDNSFVGAAAIEKDGKLVALQVLVFPEAIRGAGEGHHPWDLAPGSTMTSATVQEVRPEGEGRLIHVKYPDGEKEIFVPADIPVWTFHPGNASMLVPGAYVFIGARRLDNGSYAASSVIVEKDGVKLPN
jgi:hypothetical protein